MADFIELELLGERILERMSNIVSILEMSNGSTKIQVSYKFSDGTDWYVTDNNYDEVKKKLMSKEGENNG